MAAEVKLKILGDEKDLLRSLRNSSRGINTFERDLKRTKTGSLAAAAGFSNIRSEASLLGRSLIGGGGSAGLALALRSSVLAASDLQEQIARTGQVFDSSARSVIAWSKTTAQSMGIAQNEALTFASTFGLLFRNMGKAPAEAEALSKNLVRLAADLASFSNVPVEEALTALRSGLTGEVEPLRRFGVFLSETRTKAEALATSGKSQNTVLTNSEKVMARYALVMKDTARAQGDFKRTSEGFANQTRILTAQFRDLSGQIGTVALPVLTDYIGKLNDGIKSAKDFSRALRDIDPPGPLDDLPGGGFVERFAKGLPKDIAKAMFGPDPKVIGRALADGLVPGTLAVDDLIGLFGRSRQEFAKPYDFSAVNALTAGLQTAGLAAKDLIEARQAAERAAPRGGNITAEQRNRFFDDRIARQVDRVQDIGTIRGQIARLREIADAIQDRIAVTKDITRRLNLEDDLLQVQRDIRSRQNEIAQNALAADQEAARIAKDRAEAAKELTRQAREAAAAAREARQFRVLGLGPGGAELIPSEAQLRRRVEALGKKGGVVTKKIRNLLGDSFKGLSEDVRRTVDDMLDQIDDALRKHTSDTGPITEYRKQSANAILAGLGLSPDEIRAVRNRLAGVGIGGQSVDRGQGVGAFGVVVNVDLDGEQVTKKVTVRQQQARERNPRQKRGSRAALAQ